MASHLQLPTRGRHHHRQHQSQNGGKDRSAERKGGRVLKIAGETDPNKVIKLPDEHQNLKVQESDGNFFENFTALSWRQENKRLRATNEDDRDHFKPPPSEVQFVSKPKFHILSRKEFELLYVEVLYTIKHKIGTTIGGHLPFMQDLYQYAQEAFKVSPEDHARLLAQATKEKPPIVILNCTVLEARNLEAKDADGFSDPYCMLGIMPGRRLQNQEGAESGSLGSSDEENNHPRERDRRGGFKKFSLKKKDSKSSAVRDLLPAKYIQTTSVMPNTLNPVWNEKFRFDLEDVYTDHLHLDIWDHDDEFSVIEAAKKLNEVQGLKGLGRYFKQVAQSARTRKSSGSTVDDFLGCLNVQLDDIPSSGHDKWYQLEGRSAKSSVDGQIKLRLTLATREDRGIPEDDNWTDVRQHEDLMAIFIEHEVRKCQDGSYKWNGEMPQAAETIIHQHAIQGDITQVQQSVCRWMAYSRKHLEHPLDYQLLLTQLRELDKLWEPTALSREEGTNNREELKHDVMEEEESDDESSCVGRTRWNGDAHNFVNETQDETAEVPDEEQDDSFADEDVSKTDEEERSEEVVEDEDLESVNEEHSHDDLDVTVQEGKTDQQDITEEAVKDMEASGGENKEPDKGHDKDKDQPVPAPRRSTRQRKPPDRFGDYVSKAICSRPFDSKIQALDDLIKSGSRMKAGGRMVKDYENVQFHKLEECLAESFNSFIDHCLVLIRKQREVFPTNNRQALQRIEGMLLCLAQIYQMKVFRHICPFQKELHPEVTSVLKKSAMDWYERVRSRCRQHNRAESDEDIIHGLLELTNTLNVDLHHAVIFYTKLYEQILDVQYFKTIYRQIEKMLAGDIESGLTEEFGDEVTTDLKRTLSRIERKEREEGNDRNDVFEEMGTQLFELYLAIQEFCKFKEHLPPSVKKDLAVCSYYKWFNFAVEKWLVIAKQKCYKRIHKAVELDKNVDIKNGVKYSTSAVDVCCCFSQITEFWKNLDWPDLIEAYPMVKRLTDDVCGGAMLYAELIHNKLIKAGYYDEEGQFDITEQLCITINNIEQVRKSLSPMPEMLQFNEIKTALEQEHNHSKADLMKILSEADKDMINKIKQVVDRVADKMRPDIKKDVFHLNWAPEAVPADDAIGDLLEYLDSNLLVLNTNLLKANFDRILDSIWVECLEEFREALETEEVKQVIFYQRMFDALGLLVQFFNANDKGLPMQNILSPMYKKLRKDLELHKMDTASLIEVFYEEKLEEQKQWTSTEFGVLNVRVWYKQDAHTMLVEVLSAKDVIPLDANGLSDPYVIVTFCPEHLFPTVPSQTTKIVKKTLNPEFDESFEFNVSLNQCRKKGAALVFTVMDHDYLFENDFAGEVYIPLAEIPGVDGDEVTGYEQLSVISLPLMQPRKKKIGALGVLETRTWDRTAQEFVKLRTKVQEQST